MAGENEPNVKGVADVVFVLDKSGSMSDVVQGVQNYIAGFVDSALNDPQSTLRDVRLGLVTHDAPNSARVHWAPFVTSSKEFQSNLAASPSGCDEFGLPAVDTALDFPWRAQARRYIVFFTDEGVDGGTDSALQRSKLMDLGRKMAAMHVHFIGFGPQCDAYAILGKTPGSDYRVTGHSELDGVTMKSVLEGLGKTVSQGIDAGALNSAPKNLYGLPAPRPS